MLVMEATHFVEEEGHQANDERPDGRTELQGDEPVQAAFPAKQPPAFLTLLPLCQCQAQIPARTVRSITLSGCLADSQGMCDTSSSMQGCPETL